MIEFLKKNGYLIPVSTNKAGDYMIEYSNDNLKTNQVKVYTIHYKFLEAFESRFSPD